MSYPPYETLEVAREPGGILRVWLNRPAKRNALNTAALDEIADCFQRVDTDWETRVVVLGGRGQSFCAGADLKDPPASHAALVECDGARAALGWPDRAPGVRCDR